jgi:phage shock protein E
MEKAVMKNLLAIACLALLVAGSSYAQNDPFNGMKPQAIIDVRTPQEFAAGHVQGAINIPYERIGAGISSIRGIGKDSPLVLYCRSGRRSAIAKKQLEGLGYGKVLDAGGMSTLARSMRVCAAPAC